MRKRDGIRLPWGSRRGEGLRPGPPRGEGGPGRGAAVAAELLRGAPPRWGRWPSSGPGALSVRGAEPRRCRDGAGSSAKRGIGQGGQVQRPARGCVPCEEMRGGELVCPLPSLGRGLGSFPDRRDG